MTLIMTYILYVPEERPMNDWSNARRADWIGSSITSLSGKKMLFDHSIAS